MILFYGQGGLGNQLFQYAAARALAQRHGVPVQIDPHWFSHPLPGETRRNYELGAFRLTLNQASGSEQLQWRLARSRLGRIFGPLLPFAVLRERAGQFDNRFSRAGPNTYLLGFWQSEQYFADIRPALLADLALASAPTQAEHDLMTDMEQSQSIAVHVRRGDYVTSASTHAFHGVCSVAYYQDAVAHIAARVQRPSIYVFSDDLNWCKANLQFPHPTRFVAAASPHRELWLMSVCRHNVIANSSFSWWGAWLGSPEGRVVVAPRHWFAGQRSSPCLIPQRWTSL